jgi:hypothetical protein
MPRLQQRHVGDAAQVEDGAALRRAEDGSVEGRHQRRTLAARGHVAAAEIRHHVDAGQFRQHGGGIELHAVAQVGPVPDRLAVGADGGHVAGRDAGLLQQGRHGLGIQAGEGVGGQRGAGQLVVAGLIQGQQFAPQVRRHGQAGAGEHGWRRAVAQAHQHAVHAVHAGA